MLSGANLELERAQGEAKQVRAQAFQDAKELKAKSDLLLANASADAKRIIDAANQKAQEIAGDAFAALQNVKQLEQTAKALKNVIEGYGDQFLVPTFGLLDELAEEFGFTEAGGKLKVAREQGRQMIKGGTAAACDYVEENRREAAIAFVLDAFNGKVDSILTDVRHDNFGTLEQKLKDAFALVNNYGQAFRNARITPVYLDARIEELRWAVVAHELRLKEREEQRLLKERIREEERAQREYERAMKEAEKEEDTLRKAMEKAQKEIAKATDEQRAKYEAQLQDLQEKLRAAEEKNQRALSMAQQTKTGHVYVISNTGSFGENVYKIGLTRRLEPVDRVKELGDASVPFEFDIHALIKSEDAPALEHALHKRFVRAQINKVNARKEFFRVSLQDIRAEVESLGLHVAWTMAAECREWKETQAIERAIAEKKFDEAHWAEEQLEDHDRLVKEQTRLEATG